MSVAFVHHLFYFAPLETEGYNATHLWQSACVCNVPITLVPSFIGWSLFGCARIWFVRRRRDVGKQFPAARVFSSSSEKAIETGLSQWRSATVYLKVPGGVGPLPRPPSGWSWLLWNLFVLHFDDWPVRLTTPGCPWLVEHSLTETCLDIVTVTISGLLGHSSPFLWSAAREYWKTLHGFRNPAKG